MNREHTITEIRKKLGMSEGEFNFWFFDTNTRYQADRADDFNESITFLEYASNRANDFVADREWALRYAEYKKKRGK